MTTDVNSPRKWDENYKRNTAGWDLGGPAPVFKRMLQHRQWIPGRMMVLGAGRGHDAREFARYGFQVTAVDFSSQAVQEMHRLASPEAPVEILQQDIFALPETFNGLFDYVLEYTCFPRHLRAGQVCAIDPTRRAEYADLVTRLLKPNGIYIDLAFPLDGRKGGAPFAVSTSEILDLFRPAVSNCFRMKSPWIPSGRGAMQKNCFSFKKARLEVVHSCSRQIEHLRMITLLIDLEITRHASLSGAVRESER